MRLTTRDIEIINFIESKYGATIEHIQLAFNLNYDVVKKRLKKLQDNKFIKAAMQPILGKKVYYTKKMPSFHTLEITTIELLLKDKIKFSQREYKVEHNKVDLLLVLNDNRIFVIEVDIFNRTSETKINEVINSLTKTKTKIEFIVVSKSKRQEGKRKKGVIYLLVGEEHNILQV